MLPILFQINRSTLPVDIHVLSYFTHRDRGKAGTWLQELEGEEMGWEWIGVYEMAQGEAHRSVMFVEAVTGV